MQRSLERYAACEPRAVAEGSPAQMFHFVSDAKRDIAELAAVIEELRGVVRILDAIKFSGGLGKTQLERLHKAKAALARLSTTEHPHSISAGE